jgi:flagellar motor protein MotB
VKLKLADEINPKLNLKVEKAEATIQIENYFEMLRGLGPEHLRDFTAFPSGKAELTGGMRQTAAAVCEAWRQRSARSDALVLAVGTTDRVPLGRAARSRYESNTGLARARAERVKAEIVRCGIPAERVLAIVSGPRNTPETRARSPEGYAGDRMVEVWAIWSWRAPPASLAGE